VTKYQCYPEYPSSPVCPLVHALTSITTPSGDRTTIDAEVGGLTSDQSSSAIRVSIVSSVPVRPSPQEATRRLAIAAWQPSQPPGTEHDGVRHITSHHITPHHTTSPHHSVSSGVESHQVEHVRFLGLGRAEYKYKYKYNPK
jgi:hypothetical protein